MRVVVDTNIFVSSFFGGKPRKIIDLWKIGEITLCVSSPILDEYVEVLQLMGLKNSKELEALPSLFSKGHNLLFTGKTPKVRAVVEDPDDDKFIECALALKAEVVITGDKRVLAVKEYMGIKIVSPAKFGKFGLNANGAQSAKIVKSAD